MAILSSNFVSENIVYVITLVTLVVIVRSFLSWYRLRHFSGPLLASLSKLWIVKCCLKQNLHTELKRLCDEHGSLARVGPDILVTDDLDYVLKISGARSTYTRSDIYSTMAFDWRINSVLSETNEVRHQELRRKLTSGYSGKDNQFLEQSVNTQVNELIQLIDREYVSTASNFRRVDFSALASYFTLDVITDIAFGEPFGFLAENRDINGYCQVGRASIPVFEWFGVFPDLYKILRLPGIRSLVMPSAKDTKGVGMLMGFAKPLVYKRYSVDAEEKYDMLGSFVKKGLSPQEAEAESCLQILAGSDTTVTALRSTMLYIITNPNVLQKVVNELDNAAREGRLDDPVVSDHQASQLPYLLACIRESMRMIPPVFNMFQKLVPPEGDTINGNFIPGGTRIGACIFGILRSKKTFGEDADAFRPERWLIEDGPQLARMYKASDITFGSGRYMCLGKSIAMMELNKTLSSLLRRYDISSMDSTAPWYMWSANGIWFQEDMWVQIRKRE